MEAVGAFVLSILLAVPFLDELRGLIIVSPKTLKSLLEPIVSAWSKRASPEILQYYPKESISFNPTTDSTVQVAQLRSTTSSPTLTREVTAPRSECADRFPAIYSSSFVGSERTVPVVDISWNYEWYRFKAFEASLRSRYGLNYPPGEVVLNSMQLNLPDSRTKVVGRRKLSRGLFDFLEEGEPPLCDPPRTLEMEYLNPLDHFVAGHRAKALTEEKSTETKDREESILPIGITRPASPIAAVVLEGAKENFDTRRVPKVNDSCIPQYKPARRHQYRLANAKLQK